jgi:hypothetical protein
MNAARPSIRVGGSPNSVPQLRHCPVGELNDDGFFDCIRGICPKGHERTLED